MTLDLSKVATVLDRIKTPLTLCGLVVLVLYGLYSQVLELPGFAETLPSGTAADLLHDIVEYVFWLAILAVILGVGAYLAVHLFPHGWRPDPNRPVPLKVSRRTRKEAAKPPTDGQAK